MRRASAPARARFAAIAALALLSWPVAASAHLNTTGLGPIYDGLVHFATSAEDLLATLALALWAGARSAGHARRVMFGLPLAWLLGGLLGSFAPMLAGASAVTSAVALLLLGGLLAAAARLSPRAATLLAAGAGLSLGFWNGAGMGSPAAVILPLVAIAAGVFALAAIAGAIAASLRVAWTRIALRVVGSWIAATGLLALGWTLGARPLG